MRQWSTIPRETRSHAFSRVRLSSQDDNPTDRTDPTESTIPRMKKIANPLPVTGV